MIVSLGLLLLAASLTTAAPQAGVNNRDATGARVTLCTAKELTGDCYTALEYTDNQCETVKNYDYGDKGSSFGMNDAPFQCQLFEHENCLWAVGDNTRGQRFSGIFFPPGMMKWEQAWAYRAYKCWPQAITPGRIEGVEVD